MATGISKLLDMGGRDIAVMFGVESLAVEVKQDWRPIFDPKQKVDSTIRDAFEVLDSPNSFVLYDHYSERETTPGTVVLAVRNKHPMLSIDRENASRIGMILGYMALSDSDLDAIVEQYNSSAYSKVRKALLGQS